MIVAALSMLSAINMINTMQVTCHLVFHVVYVCGCLGGLRTKRSLLSMKSKSSSFEPLSSSLSTDESMHRQLHMYQNAS